MSPTSAFNIVSTSFRMMVQIHVVKLCKKLCQKQSEIEEKLNSVTVPRARLGQKGKLESERRVL